MRTNYTTQVTKDLEGKEITVVGWINNIRDHGGVYFIDLRDSMGILQLVANPTLLPKSEFEKFHSLRDEWVIQVTGEVRKRGEGLENPNLLTGDLEVLIKELKVLSKAKTLPFKPGDKAVNEDLRLKYRYLDMRDSELQSTLERRSHIAQKVRSVFSHKEYVEVETPLLIKSSEGGAEEIYATSKLFPGSFYSLPQSPQMYKQMLMVGGLEKYYSFAKCFRAESARQDRNIEFTQIDMERSFVGSKEIMGDVEEVFNTAFIASNKDLEREYNSGSPYYQKHIPFEIAETSTKTLEYFSRLGIKHGGLTDWRSIPEISYEDAMNYFGSDKPDLRFEMALVDVKPLFLNSSFDVFSSIASKDGNVIKALIAKDADHPEKLSKKKIKDLEKYVMDFGAKGLAYFQCKEEGGKIELKGPLAKMMTVEELDSIVDMCALEIGDIVFFGAGEGEVVLDYMGRLRLKIAKELSLMEDKFYALWVTKFPLFEKTAQGGLKSMHHPFTSPIAESWESYKRGEIGVFDVLSDSYDLVLNGVELGGGSVRIHDQELQYEIFNTLQLSKEDIQDKFSFFIEALSYGTPPHAGFAFGYDRLVSLFLKKETIREVIAFPKTQSALCSMTSSPNQPDVEQMKTLGLRHRNTGM